MHLESVKEGNGDSRPEHFVLEFREILYLLNICELERHVVLSDISHMLSHLSHTKQV
jgi:hypothetical protein